MKHFYIFLLIGIILFSGSTLYGSDMRNLQIEAEDKKQVLAEKAAQEQQAAKDEARIKLEQMLKDKAALDEAISELKAENGNLHQSQDKLVSEIMELQEKEGLLSRQLAETDSVVRELVGVIRINAKDIGELVKDNPQSAVREQPLAFLENMANQSIFPGMAEIQKMVDIFFDQIKLSGEVSISKGPIIDRTGREVQADIMPVGPFSATYHYGDEFGFLNYSSAGQNLYALSRLPSGPMKRQIKKYMLGKDDAVPVDVSRGAALLQLTNKPDLWQQISRGGALVWPILAILVIGMGIVAERAIFLARRHFDGGSLIRQIDTHASDHNWDACVRACESNADKPVARVIKAGIACFRSSRQEMEDILQEAILREIPAMERFLSTLGMLAAIAPLLGLLGTVTGMIDTFQVITMHGTGDPRMMSGGISVALVTTMLGLSVAIPIMLAHTLLGRAVDNTIGQMEEKAVALVNIFHKNREDDVQLA
ncbi:MAG: DUF3450 family protein [Desulfobacteraceae bacterium]|jgi:biopolymer transport protein ExbB